MTARVRPTVSPVCPTGIDLRLVEAMMKTKTAVKKISARITVARGKPSGEWMPYPLEANPVVLALKEPRLVAVAEAIQVDLAMT